MDGLLGHLATYQASSRNYQETEHYDFFAKTFPDSPLLLATNLTTRQATLRAYRRRPWIEETFGDMKKHGFDLESTHLCHFLRLSRLTLAVAVLYVWLVAIIRVKFILVHPNHGIRCRILPHPCVRLVHHFNVETAGVYCTINNY